MIHSSESSKSCPEINISASDSRSCEGEAYEVEIADFAIFRMIARVPAERLDGRQRHLGPAEQITLVLHSYTLCSQTSTSGVRGAARVHSVAEANSITAREEGAGCALGCGRDLKKGTSVERGLCFL